MSEHTPGPWRHSRDRFDDWGYVRAGERLVAVARYDIDDPTEAELNEHRRNHTDPCEANARLIAAAPELLAALRSLLEPMCSRERHGITDERVLLMAGDYEDNMARYDAARAAVAKAIGR